MSILHCLARPAAVANITKYKYKKKYEIHLTACCSKPGQATHWHDRIFLWFSSTWKLFLLNFQAKFISQCFEQQARADHQLVPLEFSPSKIPMSNPTGFRQHFPSIFQAVPSIHKHRPCSIHPWRHLVRDWPAETRDNARRHRELSSPLKRTKFFCIVFNRTPMLVTIANGFHGIFSS